ncbi:ABC transporter permease subunit, partial [Streptomyces roseolus]|uniref:ABC transporter permease subunit n=1 Tax=Streptomyces roseolus TaxID=67358 RepID=UPI00364F13CE
MFDFLEGYDLLGAFWVTVQLAFWSALGSLVWGTLLAAKRVGPVPLMRGFATAYVTVVRNIPLTVIIVFTSLGLFQTLGISLGAAAARLFAAEGAAVVLTARRANLLENIAGEINERQGQA